MALPVVLARARPTGLLRTVVLDLSAAVGIGMTTALVSSILPAVARRDRMEPIGLAVLAAAPFIANLVGAFAGRLGPRTPKRLALTRALGAGLLVIPVVFPVAPVFVAVAVGFWLTISFGIPLQLRLWGDMYPGDRRTRLIGIIGTGRAASAGIAAVAGGALADRLGGVAVIALVAVIGALLATASAGLPAMSAEVRSYSARASLRALGAHPGLRQVALAQAFYGGGLIAAVPLYVMVQVDRLGLSLAEIGLIGIFGAAATALSSIVWGVVGDRRGGVWVMRTGSLLGVCSMLAYVVAPSVGFLWVAAIAIGLGNAAIDIGLQAVMAENTSLDDRPAAMAGWNAVTGARGIAAPLVATGLVQAGILDLSGALVACVVTTATGTWLYFRVGRETTIPRAARERAVGVLADARGRAGAFRVARSEG